MNKAGNVHAKYNTPVSKRQKPYFLLICRESSYMYMYFWESEGYEAHEGEHERRSGLKERETDRN